MPFVTWKYQVRRVKERKGALFGDRIGPNGLKLFLRVYVKDKHVSKICVCLPIIQERKSAVKEVGSHLVMYSVCPGQLYP